MEFARASNADILSGKSELNLPMCGRSKALYLVFGCRLTNVLAVVLSPLSEPAPRPKVALR